MNYCIKDSEFLGCYTVCDEIDTGINATSTGEYTLRYFYLDSVIHENFQAEVGMSIILPNIFNEFGSAVFQILDETDTPVVNSTSEYYIISFNINGRAC